MIDGNGDILKSVHNDYKTAANGFIYDCGLKTARIFKCSIEGPYEMQATVAEEMPA